jgi:hypothetical protein
MTLEWCCIGEWFMWDHNFVEVTQERTANKLLALMQHWGCSHLLFHFGSMGRRLFAWGIFHLFYGPMEL